MRSLHRFAAAALVIAVLIAALHFLVVRRFSTSVQLRRAADLTRMAMAQETPDYERPSKARQSIGALEDAFNGSVDDQRVAMILGSNLLAIDDSVEAERLYAKALSWGERPEIYVALATAQTHNGKTAAAIDSVSQALAFDPYTVVSMERADVREEAVRRFLAAATPRQRAEMYLNMSIAYLWRGYADEAVEMAAVGAMHDARILQRPELVAWGDVPRVALRRYSELQRAQQATQK